jgi:hypothetical protein
MMSLKKDIRIISVILLIAGIDPYAGTNRKHRIFHKIYVFLIFLMFAKGLLDLVKIMVAQKLDNLIPFLDSLNRIFNVGGIWLLLGQNLVFSRKLDSVFQEFLEIDRLLENHFDLRIDHARLRKKFYVICCGLLVYFVLYVTVVLLVVYRDQKLNISISIAQLSTVFIIILFGFTCWHIVFRIQLLNGFIKKRRHEIFVDREVQLFQQFITHIANIVRISNRYFGLKCLTLMGKFSFFFYNFL